MDTKNTHTFVRTAIEAYEFPKLIPTTVGNEDTSIGASAVPFCLGVEVIAGSLLQDLTLAWEQLGRDGLRPNFLRG